MPVIILYLFGGVSLGAFLWIAAPTSRHFLRRSWIPTARNDAIMFQAQHLSSHP